MRRGLGIDGVAEVIDVEPVLAYLPGDADGEEGELHETCNSISYAA
jgi:hypothetical protein